jgi:hypothetical protein
LPKNKVYNHPFASFNSPFISMIVHDGQKRMRFYF